MNRYLASLLLHRRLLKDFIWRDLKGRYMGSAMGFFWSVLFPIVNLAVYVFVFRLVLHVRWSDKMGEGPTTIVMLVGILIWGSFAETISRSTNSLVENSNLIQKVVFPSEILPPFLTVSAMVNMLIGLPIALLAVAYLAYVAPALADNVSALQPAEAQVVLLDAAGEALEPAVEQQAAGGALRPEYEVQEEPNEHNLGFGAPMLLAPVLLLFQMLFTIGLGSFFAAFNLLLRDTYHLIGVLLTVWMFSTPIFYPGSLVPEQFSWLLQLNPMYWLIESYRAVLIFAEWPNWILFGRFLVVSVVVFALGTTFFMSQKARFPDLI